MTNACIHCKVLHYASKSEFFVTILYADAIERENFWQDLVNLSTSVTSWTLLVDFNVVRNAEERLGPNPPSLAEMLSFNLR